MFSGIPREEAKIMLSGNAAKVFDFDMVKLDAIGARIGPSVEDFETAPPAGEREYWETWRTVGAAG